MANKAFSVGIYIHIILDDDSHLLAKSGVSFENPYGGSINNIAIYTEGDTGVAHWWGDYTSFDNPSATSGAELKEKLDALLSIGTAGIFIDEGNSTSTYTVEGLSEGNASSEYSILEENIDEGGA